MDYLLFRRRITKLVVQHVEYIPFGEVFIEERNNTWNTPYLFNSKELDEETGMYYYGARYYDPRMSIFVSVDPLAEQMRRFSPYNYVFNNPIIFVDPDEMKPFGFDKNKLDELKPVVDINETSMTYDHSGVEDSDTVIITRKDADKATKQLNKSSSLKITRNKDTGVLSAEGKAETNYDKALLQAITDTNITVNLETVTTETITVDGVTENIYVGAYGGSVKNSDGSIDANQFININHVEKVVNGGVTKQGNIVGHEVNESYIAAKHNGGDNKALSPNGEAAYLKGHNAANNLRPIPNLDGYTNNGVKYLMFPDKTIEIKLSN